MENLLRKIVEVLVDHPDKIKVCEKNGKSTCMLELEVAQPDIGKVIGRKGKTADSIRTILTAIGKKKDKRIILDILG